MWQSRWAWNMLHSDNYTDTLEYRRQWQTIVRRTHDFSVESWKFKYFIVMSWNGHNILRIIVFFAAAAALSNRKRSQDSAAQMTRRESKIRCEQGIRVSRCRHRDQVTNCIVPLKPVYSVCEIKRRCLAQRTQLPHTTSLLIPFFSLIGFLMSQNWKQRKCARIVLINRSSTENWRKKNLKISLPLKMNDDGSADADNAYDGLANKFAADWAHIFGNSIHLMDAPIGSRLRNQTDRVHRIRITSV